MAPWCARRVTTLMCLSRGDSFACCALKTWEFDSGGSRRAGVIKIYTPHKFRYPRVPIFTQIWSPRREIGDPRAERVKCTAGSLQYGLIILVPIKEGRRTLRIHTCQTAKTSSWMDQRSAKNSQNDEPCAFRERTNREGGKMEELEIRECSAPPSNQGSTDGKFSFSEIFDYILNRRYPEGISKVDKNALRRQAKFFRVNDKDL